MKTFLNIASPMPKFARSLSPISVINQSGVFLYFLAMSALYFVYEIINPNGKVYVGITKNIKQRFSRYRNLFCYKQPLILNSLKKYGPDAHVFKILTENVSAHEASNIERDLVSFYKQNKMSLNAQGGGLIDTTGANSPCSKPVYQMSLDKKIIKLWNSISDVARYYKWSPTSITNACKQGYRTNFAHGFLWQYKSDYENGVEIKINFKEKPIVQFSASGEFIKIWKSIRDAERSVNGSNSCISNATRAAYNTNYSYGYLWLTLNDYLNGVLPIKGKYAQL